MPIIAVHQDLKLPKTNSNHDFNAAKKFRSIFFQTNDSRRGNSLKKENDI